MYWPVATYLISKKEGPALSAAGPVDMVSKYQSAHFPGLACKNHVAEGIESFAGFYLLHLIAHCLVVAGRFHVAYNAKSNGEAMAVHHGELLVEEVGGCVGIVNEHIVHGVAVFAYFHRFQKEAVADKTVVSVGAENHFLAMTQKNGVVGADFTGGDVVVDAVVENHTVLQNLHYGGSAMARSCNHNLAAGVKLDID